MRTLTRPLPVWGLGLGTRLDYVRACMNFELVEPTATEEKNILVQQQSLRQRVVLRSLVSARSSAFLQDDQQISTVSITHSTTLQLHK